MPNKMIKRKTNRDHVENQKLREHDQRSGKATASRNDTAGARKRGEATTKPRTKGRANRDRSDNKKVASGR